MSIKSIFILAFIASSAIAAPKIWDGTADTSWYAEQGSNAQEYSLSSAEQLAGLALLVNKGNSFAKKTIQLESDIFLNDTTGAAGGTWASIARTPWVPIGTASSPFEGEFDGVAGKKNRKIYGLYFNDSTKSNVGLFGYTNNVMIKDIDLLVGRITAANNTGALIGHAVSGSVINVHSEVKVTGKNKVGGLVGYSSGTLNRVSVSENVTGRDSVGGLVGYASGSVSGTVKNNSFFVGDVVGRKYVGGAVGYGTSFSHIYTEGTVKGDSNYIGGLVGYATATIDSSYHAGGNVEGHSYVGGLAGYAYKKISFSYHGGGDVYGKGYYVGGLAGASDTVMNSYAEGVVNGKSNIGGLVGYTRGIVNSSYHINGDVSGDDYVGGLAGYASKRVLSSHHYDGNIVGKKSYVGGLVGYGNVVENSFAKGVVKSDSSYVGGLIGYTGGTVSSSYHIDGDVSGFSYVGGLVGYAGAVSSSYHNKGNVNGCTYVGGLVGYGTTIKKSNVEGLVKGTSSYVGGLAGSSAAVDSSYYIGIVSGYSYVGGLVGTGRDSIKNSYSENSVEGSSGYVGGLVGKTGGTIVNSHFKGLVSGAGYYVGGVAGYGKNVDQSYVEGSVKSTSNYVGGLIGYAEGTLTSSYHIGDEVTGLSYVGGLAGRLAYYVRDSYSECSVVGSGDYVGGLVGLVESSGALKNLHFIGNVKGKNYVGGLVGKSFYSTSSSMTVDVITNSYSVGNVVGEDYVGGVIGLDSVYRSSSSKYSINRKIRNSYSQGTIEGQKYVGGVVGRMSYGFYSNYSSNFSLTLDSCTHFNGNIVGFSLVGGIAGSVSGSISNSISEGNVVGNDDYVGGIAGDLLSVDSSCHKNGYVKGNSYVGGLAGSASNITNSSSEGDVNGSSSYVGGLAGSASNITDSHSKGDIGGERDNIGGLAGYVSGDVRNSYADGSVKGRNLVGGLAGCVLGSTDVAYSIADSVIGVYQVGGLIGYAAKMVDSSYATGNVKGDDNVGGLIGSAYGDVSNSYALGNILVIDNYSSAGSGNRGGLVGYQWQGSISKSMAVGNVFGNTKIGGLVGRFDGTSISQSYANGNVTGSYYGDPSNEIGNIYIGGLVGVATKGSLVESYASGNVRGDDEPAYIGCVIGGVIGSFSIENSYYDKTKCNLTVEGVGLDGEPLASLTGTPDKTTAEMQTQSTFEDWDFTDSWKIMENTYPFLQIYANSLTNATVETASLEGYKYDGTAKTPLVTSVTLFGETLDYETEYTIAYKNNVNAGIASIEICGVKPYGGCKVVNFEIQGIAVTPTIAAIENVTYTGRAQTPEIKVYSGETLLAATDYTVEYKDNVNAGMATVSVTMKGNYSGSASQTFKIEKATPVISQNPKASDVVVGETLASSELTGGRANVDGEFVWKSPSTKPSLENEGYAVVFVPADTNYTKSAEIIVPVKVLDVVYVAVHAGAVTLDSVVLVKGAEYTLPEAPEKTGYDFKGLYIGKSEVGKAGDKIAVTENTIIDAVYQVKTFMVTFSNGSVELQTVEVAYGEMPKYSGVVPTKTATAQYAYLFKEWSPELTVVTGAASYTAVFDSVVNRYVITFANGAESLQSDSVSYGDLPEYKGPVAPTKSSTEKYDYVFNGWSPAITSVTGSATYAAVFDSTLRKYTITFKNGTTTLLVSDVAFGSKPIYTGVVPTKVSTEKYDYVFNGWSPAITSVTGAATYTAVFDSSFHKYAITFKNGSTTLQTIDVEYGSTPSYTGTVPTKASTDKYAYIFKDWNPKLTTVTGAASYTAVFDSVVNKYVITFANGAETLQSDSVLYGDLPEYKGAKTPAKASTEKYDYVFNSWSPTITSVTGATTYTAVFDSSLRKYSVTFKNETTTLQTSDVSYGSSPSYTGDTPAKSSTEKYDYTFKGWNPTIASVTGVATYTAVFDSTLRKYTITFKNGSTTLQTSEVAYGSKPSYTGSTPTKKATSKYTYKFKGWNPAIATVTKAATYQAVFDSTKVTGIIENRLASLDVTIRAVSRSIQISAASKNSTYAVLDMQGRVLLRGRVESSNFNIAVPRAGCYLVRVGNATRKVQVK